MDFQSVDPGCEFECVRSETILLDFRKLYFFYFFFRSCHKTTGAMIVFVIVVMVFGVTAEPTVKDSEVEVKLQFVEFDLEDFCVAKNEAEWKFLNGTDPNLKKVKLKKKKKSS